MSAVTSQRRLGSAGSACTRTCAPVPDSVASLSQRSVNGINEGDLRAFFAFFAARFSFRVLPCFFVLVFWTDLLAMTVSLVGPRPVWLCTSERCSRVRDGLTVRPLARRAPATVPGRQRRRRGGAIARRARCGHRLDHEVRLARQVAQTRPTGVGRWRSPRRVHYGRHDTLDAHMLLGNPADSACPSWTDLAFVIDNGRVSIQRSSPRLRKVSIVALDRSTPN
jgi:hypothetical protein